MKISDAIKELTKIKEKYGDLVISGGYLMDYSTLRKISVLDDGGHDVNYQWSTGKGYSVFLEG